MTIYRMPKFRIDLHNQRQEVERRAGVQSQKIVKLDARSRGPEKAHFASIGAMTQEEFQRMRERERGVGIYRKAADYMRAERQHKQELQQQFATT